MNLCKNKLYQLDGLSDILQMVPTVNILNLSKNELGRESQIKVGVDRGGSAHQSDDRSQEKIPEQKEDLGVYSWDIFLVSFSYFSGTISLGVRQDEMAEA